MTSQAGGFGGKTGLYEILGLPIKVKTKSGYQIAMPGDSIDLAYSNLNSRRGRVGNEIAHTLTTSCNQGYYAMFIDMNPDPKITELARCITTRQDNGISKHKGEHSGVMLITEPIAVLTPEKANVRQQGRRFKQPNEPMFTITVTDRHGVVYYGYIRNALQDVNTKIFTEWLPTISEYEFAAGYCVEMYDDPQKYAKGTMDENYYCEIWIPVKRKQSDK